MSALAHLYLMFLVIFYGAVLWCKANRILEELRELRELAMAVRENTRRR